MRLQDIVENVIETFTGHHNDTEEQNVLPASQDPRGDPADTFNGRQVVDASQDPRGDPADTFNGHQVLDASKDPLGDPADRR